MIIKTKKGESILVDKDDYDFLNQYTWYVDSDGYAHSRESRLKRKDGKQVQIKMHRLVMECINPNVQIDHINRNKLDNRKRNLRIVNASQNQMNSTPKRKNNNGIKGVRFKSGKWESYIWKDKQVYLGRFSTRNEAINAYNEKALQLFGKYACINK